MLDNNAFVVNITGAKIQHFFESTKKTDELFG